MWLYCLIFGIAGIIVGVLATILIDIAKSSHGLLRIDNTNPEKKLYSFEIDNLEVLDHADSITLKITRK